MRIFLLLFTVFAVLSCSVLDDGEPSPSGEKLIPNVNKKITSKEAGYVISIKETLRDFADGTPDNDFKPDSSMLVIKALGVNTNWDDDNGIIYLSSYEEESEGPGPYATTTFTYDPKRVKKAIQGTTDYLYSSKVTVANVAASDKLIGTAAELNYRSYDYLEVESDSNGTLLFTQVGSNFVSGFADKLTMKRKVFKQGIHTHTITATIVIAFTACTRC
ncbi:hypothetical protein SAMN06298216_3281 [Spirosomataceae bacterium TFI 002]|nr:hypothetical protein SAMN06298216_3281 [Spirosomataceae bacterium TFI 002]